MTTLLNDDSSLWIQLLSYDRPTEQTEGFYFLEMSTLQATTLLPPDMKIVACKIYAYTRDEKHLEEDTIAGFKTIGDFNNFVLSNPGYFIHDCDMELEGGISIASHDDGEVHIEFPNNSAINIIDKIFDTYNLDRKLIEILKSKLGYEIAIDRESNITGVYKDFDDYLKNGRK